MFKHLTKDVLLEAAEAISHRNTYMCFAIEDATYDRDYPIESAIEGEWNRKEFELNLQVQNVPLDGTLGMTSIYERRRIRVLYLCMLAAAYNDL